MAANDIKNPRIISSHLGGVPRIRYDMLEANSQSFYAGELVYSDSGAITACATDTALILGIAMRSATNVTSGNIEIPVQLIYPTDLLIIRVTNNGTLTSVAAYDHLDRKYGLYVASNLHYLDVNDTTNDRFVLLGALDATTSSTGLAYWARAHVLDSVAQAVVGY